MDERDGAKAPKSLTGVAAREVFGVMRLDIALESRMAGKER